MSTPSSSALFISIPTIIFSFCSFWAALYISFSCWLMKKLHKQRFGANGSNQAIKPLKTIGGLSVKERNDSALSALMGSPVKNYNNNSPTKKYSTASDQFASAWVETHDNNTLERPQLIMHHIFYMALCDSLLSLWIFLNYISQLFLGTEQPLFLLSSHSSICYTASVIIQFALCGTVIWNFVVGCNLFRIIFGLHHTSFDTIKRNDSIFAWISTILCTIIPMFTNNYGEINNLAIDKYPFEDKHCWINNEIYRLSLYIPVLITILFTMFLLFSVILKWYKDNETDRLCNICCLKTNYIFGGISMSDSLIVSRLSAFSIAFICVWITPLINESIQIITSKHTQIGLTAASQWSIALIGCTNCFIWSRSKNFRSFLSCYNQMNRHDTKKDSVFDMYQSELDI